MKHVVSFYQFTRIAEPEKVQACLLTSLSALDVVGTLLIATEGVNATLSHRDLKVLEESVRRVEDAIAFSELKTKYSTARDDNLVFYRLKIKVRDEIIQFGRTLDCTDQVGASVGPEEWNTLLEDSNVLVVDVRNDYEIAVGSFENAEAIGIDRFGDFGDALDELAEQGKDRPIAMFCTGGIRCEKASAALLNKGCRTVYQLDGGILGYLDTVEPDASKWRGECFVFDQRVTVDASLNQGSYDQCHACRRPISEHDKRAPSYIKGVSCPYCVDKTSARQKAQFAEREKQETLAKQRGTHHIGTSQNQLV